MPAGYEKMRDKFFEEKVRAWEKRNPRGNMSKAQKERLYKNAQGKAARIWNSRHPDNSVGKGRP